MHIFGLEEGRNYRGGGTYIVSYAQALQALAWSLHTESEIASKQSNEVQVSVDTSGLLGIIFVYTISPIKRIVILGLLINRHVSKFRANSLDLTTA